MKKTRKIEIRGVIVNSSYDGDWAKSYIERGLFTPDSHVRRELAKAEKDGVDIEIVISSQGGSVMAGNDMLNAIQEYPHGKTITIGAFAASTAANIILQAGCKVRAFSNSILLYHGAWSVTIGGDGAHDDTSKLLNQVNEPIREGLVRFGVPADVIEEGFREGRQLTMTAHEAASYGIVDEIIKGYATKPAKITDEEEQALVKQGSTLDIAAFSAWQGEDSDTENEDTPEEEQEEEPDEEQEETPEEPESSEQVIGRLKAELSKATAHTKAIQSAADKRVVAAEKALQKMTSEYEAYRDESEKAMAEATEKMNALEEDLKKSEDAHAQLSGRALLVDGEGSGYDTPTSWHDAVDKFGLNEAMKRFPELQQEYIERNKNKEKRRG